MAASNGFAGRHRRTHHSLSVAVVAGNGTGMERDYDYAGRVFASDIPAAETIGKSAGERTVKSSARARCRRRGCRSCSSRASPAL